MDEILIRRKCSCVDDVRIRTFCHLCSGKGYYEEYITITELLALLEEAERS